jgi:hypothetical protein
MNAFKNHVRDLLSVNGQLLQVTITTSQEKATRSGASLIQRDVCSCYSKQHACGLGKVIGALSQVERMVRPHIASSS